MKILVINCGSSSFKYQLLDMNDESVLSSGLVERIGDEQGTLVYKRHPGKPDELKVTENRRFSDHREGLQEVLEFFTDKEKGVLAGIDEISAIGHRIVQGGELLREACVVGPKEKEAIRSLIPLAPLHNGAHLEGIEVAQEICPHAPSVIVMDTEFHSRMEPEAYLYPLPYELYEELRIRRYGFHGTSHHYVAKEGARLLDRSFEAVNLVTCHLGNGSSLSAVSGGRSVYTTMGMTPLAGLMMGTRCGDIDPAVSAFLCRHKGMAPEAVDELYNKKSGLKGICGHNDMRDVYAAADKGDERANLALKMFRHSLKRQIGACWAVLPRVDALIFTAGIGENDAAIRAATCLEMAHMGLKLDEAANALRSDAARIISLADSPVKVMVIPTNEELEIARATKKVVERI